MIDRMPQDLSQGPEAVEWLRHNKNESALASNRFGATEEALKFVEELYALGAERVIVPQPCICGDEQTLKDEEGPYADGLTVFLPKDAATRKVLLERCYAEAVSEGFEDENFNPDSYREDFTFMWWD